METENRAHKHLSLQERYDIEDGLNKGYTVSVIARKLDRDRSTIAKEIKKHRIGDEAFGQRSNDCMYRQYCQKKALCNACGERLKKCSTCKLCDCRSLCRDYRSEQCRNTVRAPYVCNGCHCTYECRKPHFYYRANVAYDTYKALLKDTREGIGLTREELRELDCLITPLLRQGQSISHIFAVHKDEIPCSMKTVYNYIDQGIFTARNLDLPKKVKYKERKRKRHEAPTEYAYREKRTYKDFLEYMEKHPELNVVELDTVHGSNKTGNVMLTMLFRNCNFMLIKLMPECRQECVKKVFDDLTGQLGIERFQELFPVILTDNGSEFKDAIGIEYKSSEIQRSRVFYCDPLASWQKGKLEKNHEYIRKVIPKGKSLADYTQDDMTLLMNHINSTARASLNGRNPYELARLLLKKELFKAIGAKKVAADKILLKPTLLKK